MAYDGSGIFNRLFNWQADAANGIDILADRMDAEMDGFATALSTVLVRDGQAPMLAPLSMGGFRITNVAEPQNPQDVATKRYADEGALPVGCIMGFAHETVPPKWIWCNGAAVSRTTFSKLFALIGTRYGAGDGSTTFNIPDLRQEFIRGANTGAEIGTKQTEMIGPHTHPASSNSTGAHTHTVSGTAASNGAHTHTIPSVATRTVPQSGGTDSSRLQRGFNDGATSTQALGPTASSGAHTHTVSGTAASGGAHSHTITVSNNAGTENRPRNMALGFCIYAGE